VNRALRDGHRRRARIAEKFGAPSMTGATPSEARQDAVDRFHDDPAPVGD